MFLTMANVLRNGFQLLLQVLQISPWQSFLLSSPFVSLDQVEPPLLDASSMVLPIHSLQAGAENAVLGKVSDPGMASPVEDSREVGSGNLIVSLKTSPSMLIIQWMLVILSTSFQMKK